MGPGRLLINTADTLIEPIRPLITSGQDRAHNQIKIIGFFGPQSSDPSPLECRTNWQD